VLETDPRNEEIAALMAAMGAEERGATSRESGPTGGPAVEAPAAAKEPARPEPSKGSIEPAVTEPGAAGATAAADAELEKLFSRPAAAKAGTPPPAEPSTFSPLAAFGGPKAPDAAPSLEQPAPSLAQPAAAAQAQPAASADATARETGFVTETMAELYVRQGFYDRALDVYRQLVAQNPTDRGLRERMARIERELRSAASAGFGAGSAAATRGSGRDGGPAGRGAPTVRQFLAGFGTRGVSGRGPGVVPPPGGGPRNSGEFRAPQERATRAASGGSIDALFAGAPPSREDVAAASTLADAFNACGAGAPAPDAQLGGRPAHPAATELSLDSVFRDGPGLGSGRTSSGVSYDQFFAQSAQPGASSPEESSAAPPAGGSDDIEQFNAWLQGLKKR
jgi:hypothetical protein